MQGKLKQVTGVKSAFSAFGTNRNHDIFLKGKGSDVVFHPLNFDNIRTTRQTLCLTIIPHPVTQETQVCHTEPTR